jgi:hypothetical protein
MKKEVTILSLSILLLLGDWLCFQQTVNFAHFLENFSFGLILGIEILFALMIFGVCFLISRKIYRKSAKSSKPSESFPSLRRLVLSVLTLRFARR